VGFDARRGLVDAVVGWEEGGQKEEVDLLQGAEAHIGNQGLGLEI
jgi:hypothetical protein